MSNPNEYPVMNQSSSLPTPTRNSMDDDQPPNHNVRPRHERFGSREETDFRRFTPSPAHNERNNNRVRSPAMYETYNLQPYGTGGRSLGNPSEINHAPVQPRRIQNLRGRNSERV
ncbi:unnamed protein product [Cochlearia groenlandica]